MNTLLKSTPRRAQQRGIALVTVLILLLLSLTAVLGAFRAANLNELMLGSSSDYNRAYNAAEALIRDAEMDIKGRLPPYTTVQADGTLGWPCRPAAANSAASEVAYIGGGCRNKAAANTPWFPRSTDDFDAVTDIVVANDATTRCMQGICMPLNMTSLANIEDNLAVMTPFGATYGQYTRSGLTAPVTGLAYPALGKSTNPILSTDGGAKAWYWVETFIVAESASSGAALANTLTPEKDAPFVYRITAVAQGLKPGTRAVIKSFYVPNPATPNK